MNTTKLTYRAEIDGLRAIAVVSVLLYHAQLTLPGGDWFDGGFLGVDIFFVISGYLITRIILSELNTKGSFSFINFYERRARRILPMLFVVIFVSIPYTWQKLQPSDLVEYAESILASLFFSSNVYFYFSTTEYGADSSLLKPFLHTWSLGVEEQFYLVFPFIALAVFKFLRAHLLPLLITLSLLSLLFAEFMQVRNPDLNFYLPFSRFWELAVGSMLACRELKATASAGGLVSRIFPTVGLCLVVGSILCFNGETPHPTAYTLLPIVGVALIVGFASKRELIGRVLGSKPFVWVGLISYSAYLWHYPIFAFSRMGKNPNNYDKFEWMAATLLLSIVSYFLVEKTFRNRNIISSRLMWVVLLLCTLVICALFAYAKSTQGIWSRYTGEEQDVIGEFNVEEFRALIHPLGKQGTQLLSGELSTNCNMRLPSEACQYGDGRLVFLGDSFVGHYERAFIDALSPLGVGFISFNYEQCPFVSDQIWFGDVAECSFVNEQRKRLISDYTEPKIFVVSANEQQFRKSKRRVDDPVGDGRAKRKEGEGVDSSLAWNSYFENIRWLLNLGHKVVLIRSIPEPNIDGKKWLSENLHYIDEMDWPNLYNESKPSVIKASDESRYPVFDRNSVLLLDPSDVFCDAEKDRCLDVMTGHGPIYSYGRHLSYWGANLLANPMKQQLLAKGWITE